VLHPAGVVQLKWWIKFADFMDARRLVHGRTSVRPYGFQA